MVDSDASLSMFLDGSHASLVSDIRSKYAFNTLYEIVFYVDLEPEIVKSPARVCLCHPYATVVFP